MTNPIKPILALLFSSLLVGCAAQHGVVRQDTETAPRPDAEEESAIQLTSFQSADTEEDPVSDQQKAEDDVSSAHRIVMEAEPGLAGQHNVEFYIQYALSRNPEIQAARHAVAAVSHRFPQVTSLDDPMLVETFQPFDNHSVQTAAGRGPNALTLSQKFPWFGKLQARGEVVQWETQMALSRLAQAQLKVIEDVKIAYYDVAFNQQATSITEADRDLLNDLLKFAEARYRTGKTSQQDILLAQVRLAKTDDQLVALHRQLALAQADLARAVQTSIDAPLMAVDDPDIPSVPVELDSLYEIAGRSRPEIQERLHEVMRERRSKRLAELRYRPDVTAGVGWQSITGNDAISPVANGNDNLAFTVGLNIPIWRDKLDAGVSEAEQRILASSRRYDATRDDTMRLVRRLMVQAQTTEQQLELFRDSIIPKAEQALRVSTADYRVAKLDFQQILDNWSDLLMFQLQVARLEANLAQTLASLERVVGQELASLPDSSVVSD